MAALVSVIVPCFNHGRYLAECVDSLAQQSYGDWECIIVDDGSSDNTAAVCARLATEPRVRVARQVNRGLSAARNTGINLARGSIVQFLDADDLLEPNKIATQIEVLRSDPRIDIVFGPAGFFGPDLGGQPRPRRRDGASGITARVHGEGEEIIPILVRGNIGVVNAALVRRRVFDTVGRFDEELRSHEDWEFWLRCAISGCRFAFVAGQGARALVREHRFSMSRAREPMLQTAILIRERLDGQLPERLRAANAARLAVARAALGVDLIRQGRKKEGWALYTGALSSARDKVRPAVQLIRLLPGVTTTARLVRSGYRRLWLG